MDSRGDGAECPTATGAAVAKQPGVQDRNILQQTAVLRAIEDTFDAIPDSRWAIGRVLVVGPDVAARLLDSGRAVKPWQGIAPTGAEIQFVEHVLYRLHDERVVEERSMIDVDHLR